MGTTVSGHALAPTYGEALWFFGTLLTFKASADQTGGRFALVEQVGPRGVATPLHAQPDDDESFYVLEGELTFFMADNPPFRAAAGAFVHSMRLRTASAAWRSVNPSRNWRTVTTARRQGHSAACPRVAKRSAKS